jgi:hypothetical protein
MIYFVHIEKAAGTSINESLKRLFGWRHCELFTSCKNEWITSEDISFAKMVHPSGLDSITCHRLYPHKIIKEEGDYIFTIIRDPVKRLISHYEYLYNTRFVKLPSFKDWIELDENINFQLKKLTGKNTFVEGITEAENIDFIGVLENLTGSLVKLTAKNPLLKFFDVKKNSSRKSEISKEIYKTQELLKRIQTLNKEEIIFYQHFKDSIEQQQVPYAKKYPYIEYSGVHKLRKFVHLFNRHFVYKPALRMRMMVKCGTPKLRHQMSGLENNWIGHFYPELLIKINYWLNIDPNSKLE